MRLNAELGIYTMLSWPTPNELPTLSITPMTWKSRPAILTARPRAEDAKQGGPDVVTKDGDELPAAVFLLGEETAFHKLQFADFRHGGVRGVFRRARRTAPMEAVGCTIVGVREAKSEILDKEQDDEVQRSRQAITAGNGMPVVDLVRSVRPGNRRCHQRNRQGQRWIFHLT